MMTPTDETKSGKASDEKGAGTPQPAAAAEAPPEVGASLEAMDREQLLNKVGELQARADRNYDLYLRAEADLENTKKRFVKEKADVIKYSTESLIKQMLPVIDNLEKAIEHARDEGASKALLEGVELTLKGLKAALTRAGLEEVKAVGEPFDPNFHEATFQKKDASVEPGTVIEEYQKGYLLNDRLIRPSMVVVSAVAG